MNAPGTTWIPLREGARRLGLEGRLGLLRAELERQRLGIRVVRLGARGTVLLCESDVDRAALQLAKGIAA
jgi:hypothetical protein